MRLEVRQELAGLARDWDDIAAHDSLASPFLMSWWIDNAAAGEPVVLCCRDGNRLVGGAAFELDRLGRRGAIGVERLRFLGQGPLEPDHLDVVAAHGYHLAVVEQVARWLLASPRVIDLDGISERSVLPELLGGRCIGEVVAPHLDLVPGEDPIARRPGKLRSTVQRTGRRLAKEGFEVRRRDPDDAEDALGTLLGLHGARWGSDSAFLTARERFVRATGVGLRSGDAHVFELAGEEGVIASELLLVAGKRAAFHQAGRLTDHRFRGSGSVLRAATVRWAAEQGCTDYDLLRGDEPYKADWSSGRRSLRRIRRGVGVSGHLVAGLADANLRWGADLHRMLGRVRRG